MSSSTGPAGLAGEQRDSRRWWALAAVSLAAFMTYLDNNITNVAIPTIQHSLHLSVSGLEWVVSSYLLTVAGLLLAGGRLADVYGRAGCSSWAWPCSRCRRWPPGWQAAGTC